MLNLDKSLLGPPTTPGLGLHPPTAELDFPHVPKADDQDSRLIERFKLLAMETPDPTRSLCSSPLCDHESRMRRRLGEKEIPTPIQLCTNLQEHVGLDKRGGFQRLSLSQKKPKRSPTTPHDIVRAPARDARRY
ncbi:hypothetical protein N7G274_005814 [Stereocaulon virgatum]|uniref:Uncharacterized protein n=1 Tax=Stereocaulon virgatum TaxID=373712 RepID=A0ABR4AAD9_9LECA